MSRKKILDIFKKFRIYNYSPDLRDPSYCNIGNFIQILSIIFLFNFNFLLLKKGPIFDPHLKYDDEPIQTRNLNQEVVLIKEKPTEEEEHEMENEDQELTQGDSKLDLLETDRSQQLEPEKSDFKDESNANFEEEKVGDEIKNIESADKNESENDLKEMDAETIERSSKEVEPQQNQELNINEEEPEEKSDEIKIKTPNKRVDTLKKQSNLSIEEELCKFFKIKIF
jgi:hypothetical protein